MLDHIDCYSDQRRATHRDMLITVARDARLLVQHWIIVCGVVVAPQTHQQDRDNRHEHRRSDIIQEKPNQRAILKPVMNLSSQHTA